MRPIYFLVGLVSLGLGVVGILLPILPTTPFLLLSIACFSRSSKRFENWLYHTKMYQIYVADFREKTMPQQLFRNFKQYMAQTFIFSNEVFPTLLW